MKPNLLVIPIVHTRADRGSFADKIPFSDEYEAKVTRYWVDIFRYIKGLPNVVGLKVYQDGLAYVPEELVLRIVEETDTANYDVLRWLRDQGAQIMGTEDPVLLREEYESSKTILENQNGVPTINDVIRKSYILEERDSYIAKRIKDTLEGEETGLLFIGEAHDVTKLLKGDFEIIEPEINPRRFAETVKKSFGKERI